MSAPVSIKYVKIVFVTLLRNFTKILRLKFIEYVLLIIVWYLKGFESFPN